MSNLSLRKAKISDIPSIHEIEKKSFKKPWPFTSFLFELRNPFSFFYVLEKDEEIAGYFVIWDIGEEFHLANIAVHPGQRNRGYAKFMLKKIVTMAEKHEKERIRLEVRVSNQRAIEIYRKFGFKELGVVKGYYGDEDGLEFVYRLKSEL